MKRRKAEHRDDCQHWPRTVAEVGIKEMGNGDRGVSYGGNWIPF